MTTALTLRSSIASLIQRQNADARRVKDLVMEGKLSDASELAEDGDVLHKLNSALMRSNIPVVVSVGNEDDLLATKDRFDLWRQRDVRWRT